MLHAPAASAKAAQQAAAVSGGSISSASTSRPASAGRRRPKWPSPRRTPYGTWAGRAADRRCPSPAGRRGLANRRGPFRPRRPRAWPLRSSPPQASAASSTSIGRSRLPGANRLYRIASRSRAGQPSPSCVRASEAASICGPSDWASSANEEYDVCAMNRCQRLSTKLQCRYSPKNSCFSWSFGIRATASKWLGSKVFLAALTTFSKSAKRMKFHWVFLIVSARIGS